MPTIQGRDLFDAKTLGRRDHRSIDGSKRQITVLPDELGDPKSVTIIDRFDVESTACQVAQEAHLGGRPETRPDQICHLRDDEMRDDQRAWVVLEQIEAGSVVTIIGIDIRVEWAGIDQQRYEPSS